LHAKNGRKDDGDVSSKKKVARRKQARKCGDMIYARTASMYRGDVSSIMYSARTGMPRRHTMLWHAEATMYGRK